MLYKFNVGSLWVSEVSYHDITLTENSDLALTAVNGEEESVIVDMLRELGIYNAISYCLPETKKDIAFLEEMHLKYAGPVCVIN